MADRFLVTGGLGCIGAWVTHELLAEGAEVIVADLGGSEHRLRNLVGDTPRGLTRIGLDITDAGAVRALMERERPTHLIHLAALQVPFCRADPVLGARVNVVGTMILLEAAVEFMPDRVFAYASSVAAYGGDDEPAPGGVAGADPQGRPKTIYGVTKRANEDAAAIYHADLGLRSIGLRPYVVYGVGRDQGVTSTPTAAMLAAVDGEPYRITFGGRAVYHHGRDAARAFIAAARAEFDGAAVLNLPGDGVEMEEIVAAIRAVIPDAAIEVDEVALPFPPLVDASDFARVVGDVERLSLSEGVAETIERFRTLRAAGAEITPAR